MIPQVSRRSFIAGASAIPFAAWLQQQGRAAAAPAVRYDARSSQGQDMLKIYAGAVSKMMDPARFPVGDPRSWTFQWYTHFVSGATTKDDEIMRIYPTPSANRDLAEDMWDTCQAHDGEDENYFLPWHRMFVYYFESIIRVVSREDSFTLPYWNYTVHDPSLNGVIPPEFHKKNDPVFKSLYIENRNPGVNSGKPIQGQGGSPLNAGALAQCSYRPTSRFARGFNETLDNGLHGQVHVLTGDRQNMGQVPFAARDPVFWAHHCNIDRLWASWEAAGRTSNPPEGTFVFADSKGQKVTAKVSDFLDIAKLGYSYDRLEPVPSCPPTRAVALAVGAGGREVRRAAAPGGPVELTAQPVHVTLQPPAAQAESLRNTVGALPAERRLYLILGDLRAQTQPGVVYNVYLELPAGTTPGKVAAQRVQPHHVGTINFFNAVRHRSGGHGAAQKAGRPRRDIERLFSFDITDLAKRLHAGNALKDRPTVTIAPVGTPAEDAKPVVGEISIVEG